MTWPDFPTPLFWLAWSDRWNAAFMIAVEREVARRGVDPMDEQAVKAIMEQIDGADQQEKS